MPVIRICGKQVMFIHVPKTGGSSIEARLAEIGPVQLGAGNARNGFPCSPQHFHRTLLEQLFGAEDFDWSFMIVRHPVRRMVSQYRYEARKYEARKYEARKPGQPSQAPPFTHWLRETLLAWRDNPYVRDNHMRPQHEFEAFGAEVFRFEDGLDAPLAAFGRAVGVSVEGVRHWRKRSEPTPAEPSDADVQLIRRAYAEDFKRYGYE